MVSSPCYSGCCTETLNAVIGLAGSSEGSRLVAQTLIDTPSTSTKTIDELFVDAYQVLSKRATSTNDREISALCSVRLGETIRPYKFTNTIPEYMSGAKPVAIGSGAAFIQPQLDVITTSVPLDTAIAYGKTLIEYVSRATKDVGSPSQFGTALGIVPNAGQISVSTTPREIVSLDKVLYKFT